MVIRIAGKKVRNSDAYRGWCKVVEHGSPPEHLRWVNNPELRAKKIRLQLLQQRKLWLKRKFQMSLIAESDEMKSTLRTVGQNASDSVRLLLTGEEGVGDFALYMKMARTKPTVRGISSENDLNFA